MNRHMSPLLRLVPTVLALTGLQSVAYAYSSGDCAPLPLGPGFLENPGIWIDDFLAIGHAGSTPVAIRKDGLDILVRDADELCTFGIRFDTSGPPILRQEGTLRMTYLMGNDPAGWSSGLTYQEVAWPLHGGELALNRDGLLELRDATEITATLEGADLGPGASAVRTRLGLHHLGQGWVATSPVTLTLAGQGRLTATSPPTAQEGVQLPTGVIPPHEGIAWSTGLGGVGDDEPIRIAIDPQDRVLVGGRTSSLDFPTVPGHPTAADSVELHDGFVACLSADGGALEFATFIGGNRYDFVSGIDVAADGTIGIAVATSSQDFPVTAGAYDTTFDTTPSGQGVYNTAIARLTADGSAAIYSTFFGNAAQYTFQENDVLALDDGTVWISSDRGGPNPPANAVFSGANFGSYAVRMRANGTAPIAHFSAPNACSLALQSDGSIIVYGLVSSFMEFTGVPSWDPFPNGGFNVSLIRVSADGKDLLGATYIGGDNTELGYGVTVDSFDNVYFCGQTGGGAAFPATPGIFGTPSSNGWAMVGSFSPDLATLRYATAFASGSPFESNVFYGIDVDASGVATVAGMSPMTALEWPYTPGAFYDGQFPGGRVARIDPTGSELLYCSWMYSGTNALRVRGSLLTMDGDNAVITSRVPILESAPITAGAFMTQSPDDGPVLYEAAITRLTYDAVGTDTLGGGGSSCLGPLTIGSNRSPDAGAADFRLYTSQAPPFAAGGLALGVESLAPLPLGDQLVWVNLANAVILPLVAGPTGYVSAGIPVPPTAAGVEVVAQAGFLPTPSCASSVPLLLSPALRLRIQ